MHYPIPVIIVKIVIIIIIIIIVIIHSVLPPGFITLLLVH